MRHRLPPLVLGASALALVALALTAVAPRDARACGGFACSATFPVGQTGPAHIAQAGERVIFVKGDDGVTMLVEVRYGGDPTEFAWILPIPATRDAHGQLPPIEDLLDVSSAEVFARLQAATDPTFVATIDQGGAGNACSSSGGFGCGDDGSATKSEDGNGNSIADVHGQSPYVTVSGSAKVGPYDATLVEATQADALYTWLGDHGYYQDPAARPLLASYIDKGWAFVTLKLQASSRSGDVRPIVLHLGEDAPCVPLRLTSIAAYDDMPIIVWVVGPARAVPKNFLSAVVNDMALTFPNAPEYADHVSAAVDQAGGHAWVTEMSGPAADLRPRFLGDFAEEPFDQATSLLELWRSLGAFATSDALEAILREELRAPPGVDEAAFYDDPTRYIADDGVGFVHDLATLKGRIADELVQPLRDASALFADGATLTRFFTTTDAAEMTRDPIFAFNPDLPPVSSVHTAVAASGTDGKCSGFWEVTYPDGRRMRFDTATVAAKGFPAVADEPALLQVEVLDETGQARAFDPAQAKEVDALLDVAQPGTPSLPKGFHLDQSPSAQEHLDLGCNMSLPAAWILIPLLVLAALRRRARG
ncbi:MAG: DUF2330 domain-containing protein [Myxococcota bacterium]